MLYIHPPVLFPQQWFDNMYLSLTFHKYFPNLNVDLHYFQMVEKSGKI